MGSLGLIMVNFAMILTAAGGALIIGGSRGSRIQVTGRQLLLAAGAAGTVSLLALIYLLLNQDYRIAYVHEYANRNMPLAYLITAVWGGQAGSLLLWAVIQSWFTATVVLWCKKASPMAFGFLSIVQTYFFALVLFHSNPFEPLGTMTMRGIGMNPLLLNPYMAVHPPTLFLGFVGFSVPLALAIGALADKRPVDEWVTIGRPWILFAWLFLGIGNLLGMIWAYQELGWGGYWGWDPVENASFMPWLTGTALVHTALVQKQRGLFRVLNPSLALATFCLIVFGTFITRSGVIQSVHSFAGATVGPYLLGLIVSMLAVGASLIYFNRASLTPERTVERFFSVENLFQITAWILIAATAFVWIGTMAPLFTELLKGEKVASTPEFFNRWMVPLGLLLLATLGVCLFIRGHRIRDNESYKGAALLKNLSIPLGATVLFSVVGTAILGYRGALAVVSFALLGGVFVLTLQALGKIIRNLKGDQEGMTVSRTRRVGAHIVHLGVILLFLGFTGSAFTVEKSEAMEPGEKMRIGHFTLQFKGIRDDFNYQRHALAADIDVVRNGTRLGIFSTSRNVYHSHPKQPTSEVAIRTGILEDLFLIFGRADQRTGAALIRAVINPLVVWVWLGGLLLTLGSMIALIPPIRAEHLVAVISPPRLKHNLVGILVAAFFIGVVVYENLLMAVALSIGLSIAFLVIIVARALFRLAEEEN